MSTLSNIPEARYEWIVETMRLLRPGMPGAGQGDRLNAIHALMALGLAYALGPPSARGYFLTGNGADELERIELQKGGDNG